MNASTLHPRRCNFSLGNLHPRWCNIHSLKLGRPCTFFCATSGPRPCTDVGATHLAPPVVQQWTTLTGQPIPVMHYVQDGRSTYRDYSTTTVYLPGHQRNHQTARAERGEAA